MARFKDFGSPNTGKTEETLSFKLHGEEFVCYPAIPGKVLLHFVQLSDSDRAKESAGAITDFFSQVLVPESAERFDALAADPNRVVTMTTLGEIIAWLLEEYSDRPTQGSEQSPTGA